MTNILMNKFAKLLPLILMSLISATAAAQSQSDCKIFKTHWSAQDEAEYENFVTGIGRAVESRICNTVDKCMKSEANPFRKSDPAGIRFDNDCGKLSPLLRSYFACKKGLPISLTMAVSPRPVAGNAARPIRYNPYGNKIVSRKDYVTSASGKAPSLTSVVYGGVASYFTAFYRFLESEADQSPNFADFYSPRIDRDSIRPGTTVYDPNGHVVTVYKVENDGKIFFIDSHPDSSLTRGSYGPQILRSHPGQGAGFKNWRPIKLVDAVKGPQGNYLGGRIVTVPNSEIPNYSNEQYYGNTNLNLSENEWKKGKFEFDGKTVDFYEYVRNKMSVGDLRLDPIKEIVDGTNEICEALKDRVDAVNTALASGIQNQEHPFRLPDNIYGTDGDWETYSTPSRDARLKVQYIELLNHAKHLVQLHQTNDPQLVYQGNDLTGEMLNAYQQASQSCVINYTNSAGAQVPLNIEQVRQRLFDLSFDPYHCVELRWGAKGSEASTCGDNSIKKLWYVREQTLRNQHERKYDITMGFTLDELAVFGPGKGSLTPAETDLVGYLSNNP